jgi:hypothetical protein
VREWLPGAIPTTSPRAITPPASGKPGNPLSGRYRRLPPTGGVIGLRQVDGMAHTYRVAELAEPIYLPEATQCYLEEVRLNPEGT